MLLAPDYRHCYTTNHSLNHDFIIPFSIAAKKEYRNHNNAGKKVIHDWIIIPKLLNNPTRLYFPITRRLVATNGQKKSPSKTDRDNIENLQLPPVIAHWAQSWTWSLPSVITSFWVDHSLGLLVLIILSIALFVRRFVLLFCSTLSLSRFTSFFDLNR